MSKPPENLPPLPSMTKRNKHIIRDLSPTVNHNRKNQIELLTLIISSVSIKSEKLEKKQLKSLNNIKKKKKREVHLYIQRNERNGPVRTIASTSFRLAASSNLSFNPATTGPTTTKRSKSIYQISQIQNQNAS